MKEVTIASAGLNASYDITDDIAQAIGGEHTGEGLITVFAHGSTIGLTVMRYEPGAMQDLLHALDLVAPQDKTYLHGLTTGDPNGFAHVRSSIIGTSLAVPWRDGALAMSDSHRIVLIDFDLAPAIRRVFVDHRLASEDGE